jgi:hypothetical protein
MPDSNNVATVGDSPPTTPPAAPPAPTAAPAPKPGVFQVGNKAACGKGAGKAKNVNARKHGVHGFLTLGRAPDGCGYVYRVVRQLRRQLEIDIQHKHGKVSTYHGALIQSACRHEGRAALLTRWLRLIDGTDQAGAAATSKKTDATLAEKLAILKEIGAASDSRDRCLKALGLDRDERASLYIDLYAEPERPDPLATPPDAPGSHLAHDRAAVGPADAPATEGPLDASVGHPGGNGPAVESDPTIQPHEVYGE